MTSGQTFSVCSTFLDMCNVHTSLLNIVCWYFKNNGNLLKKVFEKCIVSPESSILADFFTASTVVKLELHYLDCRGSTGTFIKQNVVAPSEFFTVGRLVSPPYRMQSA